ncbi:unnamed protein product [Blepharisma stoltei]|uniref:Transmembrane protein n=1 Tax=Blepharisma stoltei TaxID=1481888 RepID=A0AAU9JUV6_9CILI|nr:unnamed protein product [Blepharisma stoltei]
MSEEDRLLQAEDVPEQKHYRTRLALLSSLLEGIIGIVGIVILLLYDDDCERPIRLWLYVLSSVFLFHVIFLILVEAVAKTIQKRSGAGSFYIALNSMLHSFIFLWILVGIVWIYDDYDECQDDFPEGHAFTLFVVFLYLGILAGIVLAFLLLTCVVCFGSWQISRFTKEIKD